MKPSLLFEKEYGGPPRSRQVQALLLVLDKLFPSRSVGAPKRKPNEERPLMKALGDGGWHSLRQIIPHYANFRSASAAISSAYQRGTVTRRGRRGAFEYRLERV